MKRTQIYLDEKTFGFLQKESVHSGDTISEIIRQSIQDRAARRVKRILKAAEGIFGIWKNKKIDVDAHVRKLRKDRRTW